MKLAWVHVRCWLNNDDCDRVLQIAKASFRDPLTLDDLIKCKDLKNCDQMVAERYGKILGFMLYEKHDTRFHITHLAVDPKKHRRRRGVASQMIAKLIDKLSSYQRPDITVAITETNLEAQQFFRAKNFKVIKILKHFYPDSDEDVYLFKYSIDE